MPKPVNRVGRREHTEKQKQSAFWRNVNKFGPVIDYVGTPCWEWSGLIRPNGYGACYLSKNKKRYAHRMAWLFTHGETDLCVLHKCDNRKCVRPDHLFLGTQADNIRDAMRKGRWKPPMHGIGEDSTNPKVTNEIAKEAYKRVQGGATQISVAIQLGISQQTVSLIARGERWAHVTGAARIAAAV